MGAVANDRFKIYYQEKLWELIPSIYRHEDGLDTNPNPNVLRALVEIIAEQAAILRRSQDRLWEDQFIELCNKWAVPYIGDLLGTRLLSALNERGQRVDVAKTIYYRRRKGTPRILEELIYDISQWDGKMVEGFQRLVRARHGFDPLPTSLAGRFTGTLPGGIADLRSAAASELADGPFEEFFHTPDMRKPKGLDGRYGITKLNFYLYRLISFPVDDATPFKVSNDEYVFDPSGRDIHLFSKRNRPDTNQWHEWHSALEWELPLPLRCRLLSQAEYKIKDSVIQQLIADGLPAADATKLRMLEEWLFRNEAELKRHTVFLTANFFSRLLKYSIVDNCGKNKLLPGSISVTADLPVGSVSKEKINAADLLNPPVLSNPAFTPHFNPAVALTDKKLAIDPVHGLFKFFISPDIAANVTVKYHYGFSGNFGAGTYDRKEVEDSEPTLEIIPFFKIVDFTTFNPVAIVQVNDNSTYNVIANPPGIQKLVVQSANKKRPYLLLPSDLVFTAAANDAELVLDGLWFGSPGNQIFNIRIQGDYECITIRNCTFDPGNGTNAMGQKINPVSLIIEGTVENICIEKSIMGPVFTVNNGIVEEEITISDSVIQSDDPTIDAINISTGKTNIIRSTVFGKIVVHHLYASDIITTDVATVTDTQSGCFRFSAAPVSSRLPRPYESFLFEKDATHWFTSKQFGHYGYAQLSDTIPVEIYRGGENGAEMGVYNSLINAIKSDGLKTKIEEYMPFGLIPAFINKT